MIRFTENGWRSICFHVLDFPTANSCDRVRSKTASAVIIIIIIILYCTTLAKRRLLRRVRVKNRGGSVRGCVHVRGCGCVRASAYAYVWVHLYAR